MSDLISRSAVIDIIHKEIESTLSYSEHKTQINIELAVEELPAAFDVDKVIAQLEQEAEKAKRNSEKAEELGPDYERHMIVYGTKSTAFEKAIVIVKAGGKSESST